MHKDYENSENLGHIYCVCVIDTVLEPRAGYVHEQIIWNTKRKSKSYRCKEEKEGRMINGCVVDAVLETRDTGIRGSFEVQKDKAKATGVNKIIWNTKRNTKSYRCRNKGKKWTGAQVRYWCSFGNEGRGRSFEIQQDKAKVTGVKRKGRKNDERVDDRLWDGR